MNNRVIPLHAISMGILVGNTFYVYLEGHEYSCKIAQKEEWECMEINALVENMLSVAKGNTLSIEDFIKKHQFVMRDELIILSYNMSLIQYADVVRFAHQYLRGYNVSILSDMDLAGIGESNTVMDDDLSFGLVYQERYVLVESGCGVIDILSNGKQLDSIDSDLLLWNVEESNMKYLSKSEFELYHNCGLLSLILIIRDFIKGVIVLPASHSRIDCCTKINNSIRTYERLVEKDKSYPFKSSKQIYLYGNEFYFMIDDFEVKVPLLEKWGYIPECVTLNVDCSPREIFKFEFVDQSTGKSESFKLEELLEQYGDIQLSNDNKTSLFADYETVEDALTEYLVAATNGNAEAQYKLANCYDEGLGGLEENQDEAFRWYVKSANQGYPDALYTVAIYYQNGEIVEKNEQKALDLYIEAAEKGCVEAYYYLAYLYKIGSMVEVDYDKAFHYALLAANSNDAEAQQMLGGFYQDGIGTEVNYAEAMNWYQKSVDNGCVYSQISIGLLYEKGLGVDTDKQKAFNYYMEAAEQGEISGYFYLGLWYFYKTDDDSDEYINDWKEAFKYYKLAAELAVEKEEYEYTEAFTSLAEMYEFGWGTDKDIAKAIEWYKLAAEQSCEEAIEKLDKLSATLSYQTSNIGLSEDEQEYLEEVKMCLEENNEISSRERRLLDRLRTKLNISEERAKELEESLKAPQLTEDEQEYLEEYKLCLEEDGEISSKERRLLDRLRDKLGISVERANELESSFI